MSRCCTALLTLGSPNTPLHFIVARVFWLLSLHAPTETDQSKANVQNWDGVLGAQTAETPSFFRQRGCNSLRGVTDFVVGEYVVGAPHGQPDAVLVSFEGVAGYLSVETLHHRHSSVAVVVDVVILRVVTHK